METSQSTQLGTTVRLACDFSTAIAWTTEALKAEGFGVLTDIDVKDTMQKKLGKEMRPYRILGACNPGFAYRALTEAPETGLLLPCNVTVRELEDGAVEVGFINPMMLLGVVEKPELAPIAAEVSAALERAAFAVQNRKG